MRAPPYFFAPVHQQGHVPLAVGLALAIFFLLAWQPLGWLLVLLTAWIAYFFRDPARITPPGADVIISPADGVVCGVEKAAPPSELGAPESGGKNEERMRISVFMSVTDCHINRMPVTGTITKIAYRPGAFFNASMDKASDRNERQSFRIKAASGEEFIAVQIAGLVARRIVRWVEEGGDLKAGERIGMIRFGSRVDLYLPDSVEPRVIVGQTMIAGETIIARTRESTRKPAARRSQPDKAAARPIAPEPAAPEHETPPSS